MFDAACIFTLVILRAKLMQLGLLKFLRKKMSESEGIAGSTVVGVGQSTRTTGLAIREPEIMLNFVGSMQPSTSGIFAEWSGWLMYIVEVWKQLNRMWMNRSFRCLVNRLMLDYLKRNGEFHKVR